MMDAIGLLIAPLLLGLAFGLLALEIADALADQIDGMNDGK